MHHAVPLCRAMLPKDMATTPGLSWLVWRLSRPLSLLERRSLDQDREGKRMKKLNPVLTHKAFHCIVA